MTFDYFHGDLNTLLFFFTSYVEFIALLLLQYTMMEMTNDAGMLNRFELIRRLLVQILLWCSQRANTFVNGFSKNKKKKGEKTSTLCFHQLMLFIMFNYSAALDLISLMQMKNFLCYFYEHRFDGAVGAKVSA